MRRIFNRVAKKYGILKEGEYAKGDFKYFVPSHIPRPDYVTNKAVLSYDRKLGIKSKEESDKMKVSCKIAGSVFKELDRFIKPGVTTEDIDRFCFMYFTSLNVYPSPLGYHGFPACVCTSVNNVLCHGIPDNDIVSVDVSVFNDGFHGDTCKTFLVREENTVVDKNTELLVKVAHDAMMSGIEIVKEGVSLYKVGETIENYANTYGFAVDRNFCGHGIGRTFHELPYVHHYKTKLNSMILQKGMVFTIEPIILEGRNKKTLTWNDGWTVATSDGSRAAQFEHTIFINEKGKAEILTL